MTDETPQNTDQYGFPKDSIFASQEKTVSPVPSEKDEAGQSLFEKPLASETDQYGFPKDSIFANVEGRKLDREEPGFWATLASHGAASAVPFAGAIAGAQTGGIGGFAVGGPIGGFVGAIGGGLAGAYGASKVQAAVLSQLPADTQKSISDYLEKGEHAHEWGAILGDNVPLFLTFKPSFGGGMAKAGEGASRLQQIAASGLGHAAANGVVVGGIPVVQSYITGDPLDWQKWTVNTTLGTVLSSPWSYMQRFGVGVSGYRSLQEAAEKGHAPPPDLQADIERGTNPANVTINRILEEGVWDHEGVYLGTEKPIEEIQADRAEQRRNELTPFQRNVYGAARDENKDLFDRWHAIQREIDEYLPHVAATEEAGITGIAPSLANHLREAMAERDELAPQVRAALRDANTKAQGRFSPDLLLRAEERGGTEPAPAESGFIGEEAKSPTPAAEPPPLAPETQAAYDRIAADFAERLKAGGHPEESARMGGHLVAHQVINRAAWMGEDPWAFYQREGYQVRARGGEPPVPPPPAPHAETVDDIRSRLGEMRGEEPAAAAAPQEPKNPAPLTAQDAWDRLAANKQKMGMKIYPGTHNETVTRIGTPKHAYARQEWAPGQMVDVGFVKDLLITGKDADGNWRLVRTPDEKGQSQEYIQEPHKGIQKGKKIDFLETTKALRETAPERAELAAGKSLTGGNAPPPEGGLFDENARNQQELFQRQEQESPTFYSAVGRAIETAKQEKASPQQWLATIKNTAGVKPEEMKWLGLEDWLKEQKDAVTRAQIADYVRANSIELKDVEKRPAITRQNEDFLRENGIINPTQASATKYGSYRLPGGENYRELLLTLPANDYVAAFRKKFPNSSLTDNEIMVEGDRGNIQADKPTNVYRSSHWDEPNIVSHIRFDDRTGPNGEKVLHIAEVQSDWHQEGRKKGYRDEKEAKLADLVNQRDKLTEQAKANPNDLELVDKLNTIHDQINDIGRGDVGVPSAPFKTSWPELAMKRMLRYAVDHGYDRISWDTGAVNAERYDLAKQVHSVSARKQADGRFHMAAEDLEGRQHDFGFDIPAEKVEDYVGKDLAKKILAQDTDVGQKYSGLDLKVGGEGMKGFYDDILPKAVNKLVKKYGAKVERGDIAGKPFDIDTVRPDEQAVADHTAEWDKLNEAIDAARAKQERFAVPSEEVERLENERELLHNRMVHETLARNPHEKIPVHSVAITEALSDAARYEGFPLFQKGDATLGGININQVPYRIFFDPNAREHTIVHELWHGFHEDMRRDLAHPNCPQQLKDDYVELMKWLDPKLAKDEAKVDALRKQVQEKPESLTLTTNEREKVARAGEIYAMTGAAPTPALGRIFEKFREWISAIYRAVRPDPVKGLMASTKKAERPPEMTDTARKVFDRWFTGYGEHPIISEPEMGGRTIHDEHELDLERAKQAPHEAVAIAEHAEGELEKHVKDAPEAIRLETGTASARPTEPVAEGGVERPGGAKAGETRAEPVKAGGGVGAGSGPVPARPGKPEEDTGGLRGKPTTALDIATRPASEGFRKPAEPDFTDKAGNLKKDWTTRDDNIWDTIVENYKNEPGIATPGRRTDKEVDDIVHSFGIPSHELADGILDKINNRLKEEDIQLLKTYFTNVASEVKRLADVYEKDPTNENLRDHLIAKARMTEIQNAMMTATAQSGRNLRTFRVMKDILNQITNDMPPELFQQQLMEATGKTARQIRSEVAQLHATKTPEEVARITARLPTLGGALEDFWKGNILSGLTTVSRIFCGQGTGLVNQLVERQLAGLISEARQAIPGLARPEGVERVRLGEAAAAAKGVGSNVGLAYKAALHGLMGEGVALPGEEPGETPFAHGRVTPLSDVGNTTTKSALYASYQGIRDAFKTYDHLSAGEKGAILDLAFNTPGSRVPDIQIGPVNIPIGQANMLMSKTHAAMHAAWRVGGFAMEIHGQAYRQAAMELDAGKIQPGDFDGRVDYWTRNPTEQMVANARDTANIAGGVGIKKETTSGPLSEIGRAADKIVIGGNNWYGGFRPAGFIMPFRRIMTALMVEGLQKRTPLGLFSEGVRNDIMGKNGAVRQDLAVSRMAMGTAITMLAGYEALNGNITGAEPSDPKQREAFYRMGYQPYAFRVPGGHNWISYKGILGPASLYMGLAADMARSAHALNHGETAEAVNYALEGFFHNILDESMMRGVSDFAHLLDPRSYTDGGQAKRYVENLSSGLIPFSSLANNIRQYQDPYRRHVQTFADYMANRVPYASQTLAPEIDVWGRPTRGVQSLIPMTAIRMSTETRDPVDAKLAKIGYFPARAKDTHQGEKLSPEQYVFFATLRGQIARGMVEKYVNSPEFDKKAVEEQHNKLRSLFGSATTMAWAATSQKWPALSQQATIKKHQDRERKTENFNLISPSGENE